MIVRLPRSSIIRSKVPGILKKVPARIFAAKAGIPLDLAMILKRDERLVPPVPLIEGLCFTYGLTPDAIVGLDPAVGLKELAPGWYARSDGKVRIAVCGMGNLGHVFAGLLAHRPDFEVSVLVSSEQRAEHIRRGLTETGAIRVSGLGGDTAGTPALVTHQPAAALAAADLVVLCVPAHAHQLLLGRVVPHMKRGSYLICAPAWGGFHWKAQAVLAETRSDVRVVGIASIPWMCKLTRPGAEVRVMGAKSINGFVPLRDTDTSFAADVCSLLLGMPMVPMASALDINLSPGNQILHSAIAYAMFRGREDRPLAEAPLLYEGMTQETADIVEQMNNELIAVARGVHAHASGFVPSRLLSLHNALRVAYPGQIADPSTLRSTIATNAAYRGIRMPMRAIEGGLLLDTRSRFFAEDVPQGMAMIKGIATLAGIATPTLDGVMTWCQDRMEKQYLIGDRLIGRDIGETAAPQVFGIDSVSRLVEVSRPSNSGPP